MSKYNEIMDKVRVDDDMKKRILQNLAKEIEADENLSGNLAAEDEDNNTDKSKISKFPNRRLNVIKRYAFAAAACGVLFIGAYALIKNGGLNSNYATTESATYAPAAESAATTLPTIKDYSRETSFMKDEAIETEAMMVEEPEMVAESEMMEEAAEADAAEVNAAGADAIESDAVEENATEAPMIAAIAIALLLILGIAFVIRTHKNKNE